MQSQSIALGALIKIQRRKQNLSQSELSKGICAVSYLSKLENGEIEANDEVIRLLIEALDIKFHCSDKFSKSEVDFFDRYVDGILNYDFDEPKKVYSEIKKNKNKYLYSFLIIHYLLITLYELVKEGKQNTKKAADILTQLESITHILEDKQLMFYYYIQSHCAKTIESKKNMLTRALRMYPSSKLYYELSKASVGINDYTNAIIHIKESIQSAVTEGNFRGLIASINMAGVTFYLMEDYDMANEYFDRAHKLLNTSGASDDFVCNFRYFALVYKANIAKSANRLDEMVRYCEEAIKCEQGKYAVFGIVHYMLLYEYYWKKGSTDKANLMLSSAKKYEDEMAAKGRYFELSIVDLYEYEMTQENYFSQKTYFEKLKNLETLAHKQGVYHFKKFIDEKYIDYYVANKKYKQAFLMTNKSLQR